MQSLLGPAQLVAQSGDAVALPAASRRHAENGAAALARFAVKYGIALSIVLTGYGLILLLGRGAVVGAVLGHAFRPYENLVLPLTIGLIATSWSLSGSVALRSMLAGNRLARGEALGALMKVAAVAILLSTSGVLGAACGVAVGSFCAATVMWFLVRRATRSEARSDVSS
jgi:O-antigen/teichoic acid export membrane protein